MKEPRILWKVEHKGDLAYSPVVSAAGQLYYACSDGWIYALNQDGGMLWKHQWDHSRYRSFTCGGQGMVLTNGWIAIGGLVDVPIPKRYVDTKLMVFSPDGSLQWEKLFAGDSACSLAETSDGTILFTAPRKCLVALDHFGEKKWQFKSGGKLITAPCVGVDGTIYVGTSDGKVSAISPNGNKRWEFQVGGPAMSTLAIVSGGGVCFGTYAGELVVLDAEGRTQLKAPLVNGESLHFGSPVVLPNGAIVMSSYRAIHAVVLDGTRKWSYEFLSDMYSTCPALGADDTLYIATDGDRLDVIDFDGKKVSELNGIPTGVFTNKPTRPTLTPDGILYLANEKCLYAIQCPSGLAESPWPMNGQNPQRTNRADPKFSQPVEYGSGVSAQAAAVEVRSTAQSKPMPENPFTMQDVLQQLDAASDFPMLDNGYVFPATVRLSAFRDSLRWALVIEIVGWNNRSSGHQAIQNALYCYGNWLTQTPGLADDGFLYPTSDGEESSTFDDQWLDPEARTIRVRDRILEIPRVRKHYATLGIKLEEPGVVKGHELLRALVAEHRELFLATDEEVRQRVADLPLVLRLDEWRHPDMSGDEKPSQCETFQMIADVLANGDSARYRPTQSPNTHWKHWPMAGKL